jgi:hypothetical protein
MKTVRSSVERRTNLMHSPLLSLSLFLAPTQIKIPVILASSILQPSFLHHPASCILRPDLAIDRAGRANPRSPLC